MVNMGIKALPSMAGVFDMCCPHVVFLFACGVLVVLVAKADAMSLDNEREVDTVQCNQV